MQDRQISQFATLVTVYHWLFSEYREDIENLYQDARKAENEPDDIFRKEQYEMLEMNLSEITFDEPLYEFVKQQTVRAAVSAAQHDPLTDYIETISTLIESGQITEKHFNWMDNGTLKIWSKAVWEKYLAAKRGTDDMVRREVIEDKLKELSELEDDGSIKLVAWTPSNCMINDEEKTIRCRGFYIPNANEHELLARGFQVHKFNPQAAIVNDKYADAGNNNSHGEDVTGNQEDIPF